MTVRIAQVSDAHLSADKPAFAGNFARIAEAIRAERFDLLLATGDLNLLGEDSEEELAWGVARHAEIGPEMLCVPGSHDVGNDPALGRNQATPERVARWERHAGPAAWIRDLPGWRLVGLDCQDLDFHEAGWALIEKATADLGSRSLALVQHMPLTAGSLDGTHDVRLRTLDGLALNDIGYMPQLCRPMPTMADRPDLWDKG